jgi:CO dehydrogenase/acetyl-CoA synthase epsilon subunit
MANAEVAGTWKILYGEGNPETVTEQAIFFRKAGYQIETAVGRKAVEEALRKASYDLVVLGPTLTRDDRHHLPYMVKKINIHTKVLVMHTDGERHPYVDANIDTGRSTADAVAKVAALARAQAPAAQEKDKDKAKKMAAAASGAKK